MAKRAKKKKSATRRASRPQKKLSDLFHETLKDIYFTENKIIKTLPKMAKAAQSKELAAAFNKHLRETQGQVKRLPGRSDGKAERPAVQPQGRTNPNVHRLVRFQ